MVTREEMHSTPFTHFDLSIGIYFVSLFRTIELAMLLKLTALFLLQVRIQSVGRCSTFDSIRVSFGSISC